jgi:hypothetical protein
MRQPGTFSHTNSAKLRGCENLKGTSLRATRAIWARSARLLLLQLCFGVSSTIAPSMYHREPAPPDTATWATSQRDSWTGVVRMTLIRSGGIHGRRIKCRAHHHARPIKCRRVLINIRKGSPSYRRPALVPVTYVRRLFLPTAHVLLLRPGTLLPSLYSHHGD